jgi:hypothetical protein
MDIVPAKQDVVWDVVVVGEIALGGGEAFPGGRLLGMSVRHDCWREEPADDVVRHSSGKGRNDEAHVVQPGRRYAERTRMQRVGHTVDDEDDADDPCGVGTEVEPVPVPVHALWSGRENRWDVDVATTDKPVVDNLDGEDGADEADVAP